MRSRELLTGGAVCLTRPRHARWVRKGPHEAAALALAIALAVLASACSAGRGPTAGHSRQALPAEDARSSSAQRATSAAPSPSPAATATKVLPALVRVTRPGCCPLPFWAADSQTVLFWNLPAMGSSGIYGVPAGGGRVDRISDRPSGIHLGGAFTTLRDGDDVVLSRSADGRQWRVPTEGQPLAVSPDGGQVGWVVSQGETVPGQSPPPMTHWRASLTDLVPERVTVPDAYALSDWTAAGQWLLARVDRRKLDLPALAWFDPASGELRPLLDGRRLRNLRTSKKRTWLAVTRTFEDDPARNGLYIVSTDGTVPPRRVDLAGGYQWRDDHRLLVVPMEPGAASMAFWQIEASSGQAARVTDPAQTPLRIAAGEWSVSPDGARVAFRSAIDDAIWVLALP